MNFFHLSKIGWFFLDPSHILIILLVIGFFLLFTRFSVIGQEVVGFVVLCVLAVAALPIDNMLMVPLEKQYPVLNEHTRPKKIEGIIILGGAVSPSHSDAWAQMQIVGSAERVTTMLELADTYPKAKIVYSGGSGSFTKQSRKEADVVKEWLTTTNPELAKRVMFENQSRNTYENAINSKKIAEPEAGRGQIWLLVTSASHMPRAKAVFDGQNWATMPYPVDFQTYGTVWGGHGFDFVGNMSLLRKAIKEKVGYWFYELTGKI